MTDTAEILTIMTMQLKSNPHDWELEDLKREIAIDAQPLYGGLVSS